MTTTRPKAHRDQQTLADRHYSYLPEVCFHGRHDPHICPACHLVATHREQEAAAAESQKVEADRRRAIAEQTRIDAETEALGRWQEQRWPTLTWPERALAYYRDREAQAEWKEVKDEYITPPLF